jgi:hypothetical protein
MAKAQRWLEWTLKAADVILDRQGNLHAQLGHLDPGVKDAPGGAW